MLTTTIKALCPDVVTGWIRAVRSGSFTGDYASFDEAAQRSTGYTDPEIVAAMVEASSKARHETELDERGKQLLTAFSTLRGPLRVLDFGGAGGHYFYQLSRHLPYALDWTVVDTTEMIAGFSALGPSPISYRGTPDGHYDVTLLSGSLQYVRNPYAQLADLAARSRYLILNRLPLIERPHDRLTVQKVLGRYRASCPAWFFSRSKFDAALAAIGTIVKHWHMKVDNAILGHRKIYYSGMLVEVRRPDTAGSERATPWCTSTP